MLLFFFQGQILQLFTKLIFRAQKLLFDFCFYAINHSVTVNQAVVNASSNAAALFASTTSNHSAAVQGEEPSSVGGISPIDSEESRKRRFELASLQEESDSKRTRVEESQSSVISAVSCCSDGVLAVSGWIDNKSAASLAHSSIVAPFIADTHFTLLFSNELPAAANRWALGNPTPEHDLPNLISNISRYLPELAFQTKPVELFNLVRAAINRHWILLQRSVCSHQFSSARIALRETLITVARLPMFSIFKDELIVQSFQRILKRTFIAERYAMAFQTLFYFLYIFYPLFSSVYHLLLCAAF